MTDLAFFPFPRESAYKVDENNNFVNTPLQKRKL